MEKFQVDYSQFSPFKGIRILFEYMEEGLDYAEKNEIKEVGVWTDGDLTKQTVDFEFLKNRTFIQTFHWQVPLTGKSNVSGLKYLAGLKDLRWTPEGVFDIDFAAFPLLEVLNIRYEAKLKGWDSLKSLKRLLLAGVKAPDLSFLHGVVNLEYLRIIGSSITTIAGIENCKNLETLFLQKCTALTELQPTILSLKKLQQLNLEGCKKVNVEEQVKGITVTHISVI